MKLPNLIQPTALGQFRLRHTICTTDERNTKILTTMKKFLLALPMVALVVTGFIGCSGERKWRHEERKALRQSLQAYRDMVYLNDLTDADLIFDCVTCLAKSDDEPHMVKYDLHPDAEGCKVWAEALFAAVRDAIKIFKF